MCFLENGNYFLMDIPEVKGYFWTLKSPVDSHFILHQEI